MTESAAQRNNSSHCYYPSGIFSPGKPCQPNAKNSVCCGPGFQCLGNGLCQTSPFIDTPYKHTLYRSACTDPTFQDPACPHFCIGEEDNRQAGQGMQVCSPELGTYCCKRDYDCCTNSTLVYALGKPEIVTIIPNHTTHTTHSTHAPASAATHTATPKDDAKETAAFARNTIIGVGAGFAAAMAILILGCCFWLTRRRPSKRYRDRDRKSGVFEMDTMDGSKLAIHKAVSVSVSQLDTQSSQAEFEAPTRLELETRRATTINQVVEMFELDATPSDDERRPDGSLTRGTTRDGPSWAVDPSTERRVPGVPILEALAPVDSRLNRPGSYLSIPEIFMAATTTRPASEFTPVAGRVPTPIPDVPEPEDSNDVPPIPSSPPTMSLPDIFTPQKYSVSRPSPPRSYNVSKKREKTPGRGPESEAEALTRPGSSAPLPRKSILKTTTINALRQSETIAHEEVESVANEGTSASQLQTAMTDTPEQSLSAITTVPEEAAEVTEPQPSAPANGASAATKSAAQTSLPDQAAPDQQAAEKSTTGSTFNPD
ncbi:hypothetical protein E2P81_ATG04333 [Venturia nashicola]|nr:hypothetical protein E2P81_ATG04333 [Venturia nashicola]